MIKNINRHGKYMDVIGVNTNNHIVTYGGAQGVGNLRFNTNNQNMEIYDGNSWAALHMGYVTVGLTPDAESLLDWARKKRDEEMELEALAETNSTIKDLMDTIKQKQEQLEIVKILIEKEVTV